MTKFFLPTRPRVRRSSSGVSRIIRDNYTGTKGWYQTINEVTKRDENKCSFCERRKGVRKEDGSLVRFEVHHNRPLSKGGTTSMANLSLVCEYCHNDRHHHLKARRG